MDLEDGVLVDLRDAPGRFPLGVLVLPLPWSSKIP